MFFLGCMCQAQAQSEEEKVIKVVVQLFDGIREADTSAIRTLFMPGAIMETVPGKDEAETR